jgi:hypothetical protein
LSITFLSLQAILGIGAEKQIRIRFEHEENRIESNPPMSDGHAGVTRQVGH